MQSPGDAGFSSAAASASGPREGLAGLEKQMRQDRAGPWRKPRSSHRPYSASLVHRSPRRRRPERRHGEIDLLPRCSHNSRNDRNPRHRP
jgi:hypothetical protein